jgi:2-iminobutanoate/2-iminopropanoate deaminase
VTATHHPIEAMSLPGDRTIGPYSDAVRVGDLLFLSGRIGLDYSDMTLVEGGISAQTRRCLANISEVLLLAGSSLERVVKTTVFLTTMTDFAAMNEVYADTLGERRSARSTVAVAGLPMGALVEIEVIAAA